MLFNSSATVAVAVENRFVFNGKIYEYYARVCTKSNANIMRLLPSPYHRSLRKNVLAMYVLLKSDLNYDTNYTNYY